MLISTFQNPSSNLPVTINKNASNAKVEEIEEIQKKSFAKVLNKYNMRNISPKEIDQLVSDLRASGVGDAKDWLMLATQGYEFRSHLKLNGEPSPNAKFDLVQSSANRLAYAKSHGNPTESLKEQFDFYRAFNNSNVSTYATKNTAEKPEQSDASKKEESTYSLLRLQEFMEKILDYRVGIDREKIEQLEQEIINIQNNPNLSDKEKVAAIATIEKEIEERVQQAADEMSENEKSGQKFMNETAMSASSKELAWLIEALNADKFRSVSGNENNKSAFQ